MALRLPSTMSIGPRLNSIAPRVFKALDNLYINQLRQATLLDFTIIYYNCYKPKYIAPSYLEPYKGDLKDIKEELYND
jgi:hypothetical protein